VAPVAPEFCELLAGPVAPGLCIMPEPDPLAPMLDVASAGVSAFFTGPLVVPPTGPIPVGEPAAVLVVGPAAQAERAAAQARARMSLLMVNSLWDEPGVTHRGDAHGLAVTEDAWLREHER
jgi:hypothetical protein